ncbi:MAG: transaldolase [Deltaproteobacteria bacterium]|nr:transaldolase [Candidatus Zymogenaceae bacterium]
MQYFLDSAKLDEIVYAFENWGIDGVTTNPRHVLLSGKPFNTVIGELASEFKNVEFPISIEINPHLEKAAEMIDEAKTYADISENFVIKIPCTEEGLIAAKNLSEEGVRTNVTLVFSPSQAIQAARVGAYFVSPFVGWKESSGEDCSDFISSVVEIYETYDFEARIIVAALRSGKQIVDAALAGADIVTAGFDVYRESFSHPFTDFGLKRFQDAWDQTKID